MNFSGYNELTYVNGTSPAINATNLNKNEDFINRMALDLNYSQSWSLKPHLTQGYQQNMKKIDEFDDDSSWTSSGSITVALDIYNNRINSSGVKITETDNSGGSLDIYKTISAVNLTTYNNGIAPASTSDYIAFAFYVSDATKFSSLLLRLGDDSTNHYYAFLSYNTGWNLTYISKASFSTSGTPTGWNSITYIFLGAVTTSSAISSYIIYDDISMIRDDGSYANPLLKNDGTGFTFSAWADEVYHIAYIDTGIYLDKKIGKLGLQNINPSTSLDMMQILEDVNCFCLKAEIFTKSDDNGFAVMWEIDSSNYIIVTIESNDLIIRECVSGSVTDEFTESLDTIERYDRMELYLTKYNNILRLILIIDGQTPQILDYETSFSATAEGYLGFISTLANQSYLITDMVVSRSNVNCPPFMANGFKKFLNKISDQVLYSSTTLQNDNELKIKLPANGIYKLTLDMGVSSTSNTPDIKLAWTGSGNIAGNGTVYRKCLGISTISTSVYEADYMRSKKESLSGTAIPYGVTSSGYSGIKEELIYTVGAAGAVVQLQWAQNTSDSAGVTVLSGTNIIVEKIG